MNDAITLTHLQRLEAESHPHHARGGVRSREAGHAVFGGQGFGGHAASGPQGVFPGDFRHFRCCMSIRPGNSGPCTSSATAWRRNPACSSSCIKIRRRAARHQPVRARLLAAHGHVEDPGTETGARQVSVSTRPSAARGATRRRAAPRSGCSPSARRSIAGIRRTSGPSYGICTTPRKRKGESIRVFPISNWTELDIWQYIHLENIPIVPLYLRRRDRPSSATACC